VRLLLGLNVFAANTSDAVTIATHDFSLSPRRQAFVNWIHRVTTRGIHDTSHTV